MKHPHTTPKKRLLTSALLLALAPPLAAQVADQTQTQIQTPYSASSDDATSTESRRRRRRAEGTWKVMDNL